MRLEFKRLPNGEGLPLPRYTTSGAAAMDICSADDLVLQPGDRVLVHTGFALGIPEGHEIQIRPRSGLALKHGITLTNSPATIDSDFRGELCIVVQNTEKVGRFGLFLDTGFVINRGDRIAQLVLAPVTQADVVEVDELDETERGAGGFGSTGRN